MLAPLLVVGCSARSPHLDAPPLAPPVSTSAGAYVALLWAAPVDLDLYVTDPSSVTVYFANTPTVSGRLLADVRCTDFAAGRSTTRAVSQSQAKGPQRELVRFLDPTPGVYRVGVDFIDGCGRSDESVAYRVVADVDGRRQEQTGTITFERFQPVAMEFVVPNQASSVAPDKERVP